MRMYARHVSGMGDIRIDLLPFEHLPATQPDLFAPDLAESVFLWPSPPLLVNGQPAQLQLSLALRTGLIALLDQAGTAHYYLSKGRDADMLKVRLYEHLLHGWYDRIEDKEVTRSGLEMMEHIRCQLYRLQDGLQRPDTFMYQYL